MDGARRCSGIGSWPGTDAGEALRTVFGELGTAGVPYLPELPARGPGADIVGRGALFLSGLAVDLQPSGWRLVDRPGHDLERSTAVLRRDLDMLAETGDGYRGPVKVQVCGPWTLAGSLVLPRLERAVGDPGACRDLVESLAEGVGAHVRHVSRLLPGAEVVLQLDEPSLPAVLAGRLPTSSGLGRLRPVERSTAVEGLSSVVSAARAAGAVDVVLHCCGEAPPVDVLAGAGAGALALDVSGLRRAGWEALAPHLERGLRLWAGAVPSTRLPPSTSALLEQVVRPWRGLGLPAVGLAEVVATPACGLAGATPEVARAATSASVDLARALAESADG